MYLILSHKIIIGVIIIMHDHNIVAAIIPIASG